MKAMLAMMSVCILLGIAFVSPSIRAESMPGGIAEASVEDQWVLEAARSSIEAKSKAMREEDKEKISAISLVKVLSARQQVVAGMNYFLRLQVTVNETLKEADVVVWRQLSGEYRLTSWEWK